MEIKESTQIREYDRELLAKIINKSIRSLSFPHNLKVIFHDEIFKLNTQQIVIEFSDFELKIVNHYHESVYNTGLKYLLLSKRNVANRPYNSSLEIEGFQDQVQSVEIWGIKNDMRLWEEDQIKFYQSKGLIPGDVISIQHVVDLEHILRFVLSNGSYIIIKADLQNLIFAELYTSNQQSGFLELKENFHLWETIL